MIFFFKLKKLYLFFILCLQRKKKTVLILAVQADFKLALGLFFLEEIMQFFGVHVCPPSQGEDAAPSRLYL